MTQAELVKELEATFDDIFPWASSASKEDTEYLRLRAEYVQEELKRRQQILEAADLTS